MSKVVIFENEFGGVSLLNPMLDCGLTIEEIALKDVPAGCHFKIVDFSSLPDLKYLGSWEYDFLRDNDGTGLGADAYWAMKNEASND